MTLESPSVLPILAGRDDKYAELYLAINMRMFDNNDMMTLSTRPSILSPTTSRQCLLFRKGIRENVITVTLGDQSK